MKIDKNTGLIESAPFRKSPHFDERPGGLKDISLLVIHNITLPPGEFNGSYVDQLFMGTLRPEDHPFFEEIKHLKVASHLFIRRSGEVIQYVSFNNRAWHAGESEFDGRNVCNDFSIGIELEGTDDVSYEEIQYEKLAEVTKEILKNYPHITKERITGHSDIAPGRKTDPGPSFDWQKYKAML